MAQFRRQRAKLIWGGEAVAVRHDGRGNPNQLLINSDNLADLESLRRDLVAAHESRFGNADDLLVGLQLTHSGRYSRPNRKDQPEPRIPQANSILDQRMGVASGAAVLSDGDLRRLIDDFVTAASLAAKAGFLFVDIKSCHGYLGHELLGSVDRPGDFGGSFENRTRFLRAIIEGIRTTSPRLIIGVRLSAFDFVPFRPDDQNIGVPDPDGEPKFAFGGDASGVGIDLDEPSRLLSMLESLGVRLVCTTAGCAYYNPHILRPAYFPPIDGYGSPEDPLVGVARQILATAELKRLHPNVVLIGSGYSYLQDWLPHVAQGVVRSGWVDLVGLGRMMLSYPDLPSDVLSGHVISRKRICRTFSECTTAPRKGLISGCYPLDPFYKTRPERELLQRNK